LKYFAAEGMRLFYLNSEIEYDFEHFGKY